MSFEQGMYLAIAIMAGGSIVLGALVVLAARFSAGHRKHEHEHVGS